jgi:hypothetical protein
VAFITTIENDLDEVVAELITTHDKYQLPDGSEMFIDTIPAWCVQCATFTLVESLQPPEEMEKSAQAFFSERISKPLLPHRILSNSRQTESMQKLLEQTLHAASQWRMALSSRLSPPRCLECAGPEYFAVPTDGSWMSHPGLRGYKIRIPFNYHHASMASTGRLYDTEGWRIPDAYSQQ